MKKIIHKNEGFTLIELMIVIAIIGILAAIAIPNYIAYRNKSFCSQTESDANSVAGAIADYFAIPAHTNIENGDLHSGGSGSHWKPLSITGKNTFTVTTTDPNTNITITVTDKSGRCPTDYRKAANSSVNKKGYWEGTATNQDIYVKRIEQ